jgi:polysaccharide pyruvyl transferase WcaK-like protein
MRVFVGHNFFGAGNFGDDFMLAGFLEAAACRPNTEITICTPHDRASQELRFPQVRWLPDDAAARESALRGADLWLGLGDTPFQLDSGPWLLDHNDAERRRCAALGKPMYLLGVGCESPEAAADPRARALLAAVERVWTRDALSEAMLRPYVGPARLSTGADLAHLAFARERAVPARESGVVGLLAAFERREQLDLGELEIFLRRRQPGHTRWLIQEVRELPYLERWILGALAPGARARVRVMDADYATMPAGDYLRAFGAPAVTVTTRYHGALIAAWHRSRVVVVARSAKLRGIADELGLLAIDRLDSHEALETAIGAARPTRLERLLAARERARAACDAFFEHCARHGGVRITAGPSSAACPPLPHASLRATLQLDVPQELRTGETIAVPCAVTNRGAATYASAPPNPVELCYRWFDGRGDAVGAGTWVHTPLPLPLAAGETTQTALRVAAPQHPGRYTLAVTLLQEGVAWFDDVDPGSGVRGTVTVRTAEAATADAFSRLSPEERRALTLRSVEQRTPLLMRWQHTSESWKEWSKRAALAADWLRDARTVADLGCGGMTLERYLAPWQQYVPVDVVARDERTIVLDLNRDELARVDAEACAMLGVMEYLFDVPAVLVKLRGAFTRSIVSYNVRADGDTDRRLENGWVNHFGYDELCRAFRESGLTVARERLVDGSEFLFELVPAG